MSDGCGSLVRWWYHDETWPGGAYIRVQHGHNAEDFEDFPLDVLTWRDHSSQRFVAGNLDFDPISEWVRELHAAHRRLL